MFQNITQVVKNKLFFNVPNGEGWHFIVGKNTCIIKGNNLKKPR